MKLFNGKNEKNLSMESNSKREMFEKNGGTLYGLSRELIDYDLAFYAVKKMRTELNNVPYELIDEKIIVEAFSGLVFPEDFDCFHLAIDKSLALKMVKINGMALSLVPDDMLDRDIILEAVKEYSLVLVEMVPKNKIDKEIALEAVKCKKVADVVGCILRAVPEKLLDSEILLEAIKNSNDVEEMFEDMIFNKDQLIYGLIDRKIALEMVKKDGKTLKYIPYEMINEEILLEAIKNGCEVDDMVFIVEHLSDLDLPAKNDLFMKMIKLNAEVLSGVSNDYEYAFDVSEEEANKNIKYIVLETIRQNGLALEFVSGEIMDKEIVLEAVRQNGLALKFVPSEMIDNEIALEAVKQNSLALEFVSSEIMEKEIVLEAVRQNGLALKFVPSEMIDKEIALEAVRQNGLALEFVPSEIIDEEIALEAVKQNILALKFVPSEVMNGNIAAQGIRQNIEALKYLKEYINNKEFREAILPVLNELSASESLDDTSPKRR